MPCVQSEPIDSASNFVIKGLWEVIESPDSSSSMKELNFREAWN